MDSLIYLPDGRVVRKPDDLQDDQIEQFKLDFAEKFPFSMPEEDIVKTPVSTEPPPLTEEFWQTVPPDLRPKEFYSEGDPFSEQVKAGAASTLLGMQTTFDGELGLQNLATLKSELDEAEAEYNELKLKEESGTLSDKDKERLQELHIKIYGTQKPSGIPEMVPGQPISSTMISMEEKSRKGLKPYLDELHTDFRRMEKVSEETEVSDAFKWVIEQSMGEPGLVKGTRKAFSTFWNDLDRSQKGDFMGDVLGRSAVATSAILATSFGVGGLLRKAKAIPQIIGQIGAVSPVSGGIEYSHSIHEYLKSKGMDTRNLDSISEFVNDPKMMEEANDYALKRGAIIGIVDGVTGGIATRIIAPATITRSSRSVMPFIKKPVGVPISTPTRYGINFLAQTPLQTTLPAGAEYFAQLATLEEGEKISFGEVLAEGLGEIAFVPADMILGGISSVKDTRMSKTQRKEEKMARTIEGVKALKEQGYQMGLGDLTGELETGVVAVTQATEGIPEDAKLYDTGIPYWENAIPLYRDNPNISVTANTDADIIAPNQFFARPDGQGGFEIVDTFDQKIGESYETMEEATGTSGALNSVYGGVYANHLKSEYATMQGLDVDEDVGGFADNLGNKMLNPYMGQIEIDEIRENFLAYNPSAYERLINAIGEDATSVDPISISKDLSKQDFDALMNKKATYLNPNVPKNVTAKMFENLKKRINVEVNVNSNAFKSLALKLTGEPNFNKMSNPQKRLVYALLTSLPAHEGATISLPDFSARPYTMKEYNQVISSFFAGNLPTLTTIANALGLNPQDVSAKRIATRLREDLISAGIVNKIGTKYKFNKGGDWSLLRAQQVADAPTQEEFEEIEKFSDYAVEELKKIGLEDIATRLELAVAVRHGQVEPEAEGAFDPVWKEIVLSLAKAKEGTTSEAEVLANLNRILGHETVHATRLLDLFSQPEWNNLVNYIRTTPVSDKILGEVIGTENVTTYKEKVNKNPTYLDVIQFRYNEQEGLNFTEDALQEEAVALLKENYGDKKIKVAGQPRALLERINKFFTAINNGLNYAGFQTYEDIFDKLASGEIGARERTDQTERPVTINRRDRFGRVTGTYEYQPQTIRTPRILQGQVGFLQAATGVGNIDSDEFIPEEADIEIPVESRPLADAPNLKFKLGDVMKRPTTVMADFMLNARAQQYGNDITTIPLAIFDQTIADDTRLTRNYGRRLSDKEISDAQRQLFYYSQEQLKQMGYPEYSQEITLYGIGDRKRYNALTPSLIEAESIANGITDPPFSVTGDETVITEYKIKRSQIQLTSDVMFATRPPPWLASETNFFIVGNNALVGGTEVAYEPRIPTVRVIRREFNNGSPVTPPTPPRKPFPSMKYKLSGLTGDLFDISSSPVGHIGSENYSDVFTVFNKSPNRLEESLDRLRKWTKNPELTEAQVDKAAQEIMDITQVSLDAFPQQIRVYRGGMKRGAEIRSDEVVPVTLSPEVAKSFAFNRKNMLGRFSLQSWLIDKSEALVNIDAFQPLGYWENELLVNGDSLRIAEETAEAQDNLDYVDYMAPETLNRVRDTVATYNATKTERQINKALTKFNFPFNFFPEASASETMLREMGESAVASSFYKVPDLSERKKTAPRNAYRFPYGENFAEYMAQPEEKRRGKWIGRNLKRYPTPGYMLGQKVKYKLARPTGLQYSQDPRPEGDRTIDMIPLVIGPETFEGDYDIGLVVNNTKVKAEFMGRPFETRTDPQGNFATEFVILARPNREERKFDFDDEIGRVTAYVDNNSIYERPKVLGIQNIEIGEETRGTGIGQQVIEILGSTNPDIVNGTDTLKLYDITSEGAPVWNAMGANMFVRQNLDARTRIDGEIDFTRTEPIGEMSPEVLNYFQSTAEALERFTIESITVERGIKYKLAYPITDQEFIESKTNLAELLDSGVEPNNLMEHPAIVEGLRRMQSLPITIEKYQQRYGEDWVLNPAYANNREFIIDGKKVKGVKNVIDATIKKAESYADGKVGNNKIAWYFLGPPASGKSHFAERVARDKNLAIIDSDDVKRFIPENGDGTGANAVHKEASMLAMVAREKMLAEGKDVLIPRVGAVGKRQITLNQMRELKELGYTVNTVVVDVNEPVVQSRMYLRFTRTGRLVPPSYIAEIGNTPIDTYHRVKYLGDGFAWIDNNGRQQEEIIREDTGILPSTIGRERRTVGQRIREIGETPVQEAISEVTSETRALSIQEAIEGAKGINERMIAAGLVPKFNLNASADAIYIAYKTELKKPEADILPQSLRTKYSMKHAGKKLNDKAEALIKKVTIRDKMDDSTIGEKILNAAKGIDEDFIREQLVDRYARFETLKVTANEARNIKDDMLLADVDAVSALMHSDRAGEIWKSSFAEGIPVYDDKGYVRTEVVSPIDNQPIDGPMIIFKPAFENPQLLWAFQAVRIAKREKRFNDEGKPVKTSAQDRKDAEKLLKDYPILQEMSDAYDRWDKHIVQFLVDTGVLDVNTAKIWLANSDYFPFYRMLGVDKDGKQITKGPNIFKGLSLGKSLFVKAKGSKEKDIVDPITGVAENLRAAITIGSKNVAANRVVRDLVDAGFAEQVGANTSGPDIVKIRVGGKSTAFRVADPVMVEAFQNFEQGPIPFTGLLSSVLRVPKEALSALITRTPDFWVRQVVRDSVSAWGLLGGRWLPLLGSIKNWTRIWMGLIAERLPFGLDVDIMPEGFHKLRRAGVIAGYDNVVRDIDRTDKLIKQAYRRAGIKNRTSIENIGMMPFDIIRGIWEFLGQGTLSSDAATRLAVYEDILRNTGNEAEAIDQAREVLNFTRRGQSTFMQLMAISVPFQNPRLQGVDVFYRGTTGRYGKRGLTRKQKALGVALRFGALMSITPLYWLAVKDSDEYKEATEEVRDNYYIIPGSKTFTGETIGIPTPFEVGLFVKTVPENIIRYFADDQTFDDMMKSMGRNISQTLSINPLQATTINPIIETWANYDFYTGNPVVPYYMQSLDPELQYRSTTNNLFTLIGQETGISPVKMENLWRGYTGTYGAWFAASLDGLLRENLSLPERQAMRIDEKPLIGSLLLPPEMRGLETQFYDLQESVTGLLKTINEMEKRTVEKGDPFAFNLSAEYQRDYKNYLQVLNSELGKTAELLSQTRTIEAQTLSDNTLSPVEKSRKLRAIQATRNDILGGQDIQEKRIFFKEIMEPEIRP